MNFLFKAVTSGCDNFLFFLVALSGKLGYKTACLNVPEKQNLCLCKVKKSEYVDGL